MSNTEKKIVWGVLGIIGTIIGGLILAFFVALPAAAQSSTQKLENRVYTLEQQEQQDREDIGSILKGQERSEMNEVQILQRLNSIETYLRSK